MKRRISPCIIEQDGVELIFNSWRNEEGRFWPKVVSEIVVYVESSGMKAKCLTFYDGEYEYGTIIWPFGVREMKKRIEKEKSVMKGQYNIGKYQVISFKVEIKLRSIVVHYKDAMTKKKKEVEIKV